MWNEAFWSWVEYTNQRFFENSITMCTKSTEIQYKKNLQNLVWESSFDFKNKWKSEWLSKYVLIVVHLVLFGFGWTDGIRTLKSY